MRSLMLSWFPNAFIISSAPSAASAVKVLGWLLLFLWPIAYPLSPVSWFKFRNRSGQKQDSETVISMMANELIR